jgi:hypothetical protein
MLGVYHLRAYAGAFPPEERQAAVHGALFDLFARDPRATDKALRRHLEWLGVLHGLPEMVDAALAELGRPRVFGRGPGAASLFDTAAMQAVRDPVTTIPIGPSPP